MSKQPNRLEIAWSECHAVVAFSERKPQFVALLIIPMMTDDVLWCGVNTVNEIKKLPPVGMAGKSVNSDHFTANFDDLRFAVDEHWNLTKALLQSTAKRPFGLITDEAK